MKRTLLAFAAFFLLMCSYSILRPVREAMGVQAGAQNIQWLFTGTFIATLLTVPLFGWIVKIIPRQHLLASVYGFFIMNLVGFLIAFAAGPTFILAVSFFIWLSVFNLFVISLMWSNISDVFSTEEAHAHYGEIAAGGTAGAIAGPAVTASLAEHVPTAALLAISAVLLTISAVCSVMLRRDRRGTEKPIGGSILAGVEQTLRRPTLSLMALLIIFYTTVSTVLYVEQADVVGKTFTDRGQRTAFFATIDLIVNCLTFMTQVVGTKRIVKKWGLRVALTIIPLLMTGALLALGFWRTALVLAAVQICHRAGDYALMRPGREMVYTTVDPEARYKAKSFIDTTVYRANDAASSWLIAAVRARADAVLFVGVPAALLWFFTGFSLGRRHDQHQQT